jgi:hypothetical protein
VLLVAGVVVLWVRSYYLTDHLYGTRGEVYAQATSWRGGVRIMTVRDYPEPVTWRVVRRGERDEEDGNGRWVAGAKPVYVVENTRKSYGPVAVTADSVWIDFPRPATKSTTRVAMPATPRTVNLGTMDEPGLRAVTQPSVGKLFDSGFGLAPPAPADQGKTKALEEMLGKSGGEMTLTPPLRPPAAEPPKSLTMIGSGSLTVTRWSRGMVAMRTWSSFAGGAVTVRYWVVLVPAVMIEGVRRRRARVRRRRMAGGLCVACGYDLRASEGACPECGAARV